ncbi:MULTISPECIES: transposase family protein [Methylobacter]
MLTLYYLRHYPTLINLAAVFGISESYCHKVYACTARMLAKVEKLPNRKALLEDPAATLAIDVSEQLIERPVKNQKAYYSANYLGKMSNVYRFLNSNVCSLEKPRKS